MDVRKIVMRLFGRIVRWLKKYRTSLLVASIIFFLLMYLNLPGFQTGPLDRILGSVILVAGLINFTVWTLANRQASQARENRKIKGRRKS